MKQMIQWGATNLCAKYQVSSSINLRDTSKTNLGGNFKPESGSTLYPKSNKIVSLIYVLIAEVLLLLLKYPGSNTSLISELMTSDGQTDK